jgi:D-alanyl-D-alanine carboxypeptidase/D-alanyl-D-alanine-endopeptidase (penicillin-binding protein 4)
MLPLAGVDGSLIGRMRGTPAAGNVQAKTGSMTYVHALAGYVTSASSQHLVFAILLNNYEPAAGDPPASRELDAIAERLASDTARP